MFELFKWYIGERSGALYLPIRKASSSFLTLTFKQMRLSNNWELKFMNQDALLEITEKRPSQDFNRVLIKETFAVAWQTI